MNILVAMSGGVDSSVAAYLASLRGNAWGVYMQLHDENPACDARTKTCCGLADALDAQTVARQLGIMFDSLDLRTTFKNSVFANFVAEYKAGRTPIPCMHCNSVLKFDTLFKYADLMDCELIATGHYVAKNEEGLLQLATDLRKDQTYFMFAVARERLDRLWFPLANMTKPEVRELAASLGFTTANKAESQDICFVPGGDYREILAKHLPSNEGSFIDARTGKAVGTHNGYWRFTQGQRRGLPAMGSRYYVLDVVPERNQVIISNREDLFTTSFRIEGQNWHAPFTEGLVRTRYHADPVACRLEGDTIIVNEPVIASPGQAAVCYRQDGALMGGGWIARQPK